MNALTTTNKQINNKTENKAVMLSNLLKHKTDYEVVNDLYEKIINEYDNHCLSTCNNNINEKNDIIIQAKEKINEFANLINELVVKINKIIDNELQSEELNDIELLSKRMQIRKEKAVKEQEEILKYEHNIQYLREGIVKLQEEMKECKTTYSNRYTLKVANFAFSNTLQSEINKHQQILTKAFLPIEKTSSERLVIVYDRIILLLQNSNVFIKDGYVDLTAREWFVEISNLTYFQFEKTRQHYKNNDFQESNKLKEFIKKAEEVKNIAFLIDN